jgi:hypothetical protein
MPAILRLSGGAQGDHPGHFTEKWAFPELGISLAPGR